MECAGIRRDVSLWVTAISRVTSHLGFTFFKVEGPLRVVASPQDHPAGSGSGFMLSVSQAAPRAVLMNVVDLPEGEMRRRGRHRDSGDGRTVREILASRKAA